MACPDPTLVSGPVGPRLTIPTHVEPSGGEATHPSVVFVPGGWNGYTYWMAMTPYPAGNDNHEDPNIVASHDGIAWEVPPGLVNPIADASGAPEHHSDTDLNLVGNTMYLVWRLTDANAVGAEITLLYSTSTNGVTWSAPAAFMVLDETVLQLLSPSMLFEGGRWTMWGVDAIAPSRVVRFQGGASLEDSWGGAVTVDVGDLGVARDPWHLEIRKINDCYLGLLVTVPEDTNGLDGQLWFLTSGDGLAFTNSGGTIIPQRQFEEHDQLYRASLIADDQGGTAGYRVWYSAWLTGPPQVWNIYRTFLTVTVPSEPPPDPGVGLPAGTVSPVVTWLGCDLVTGTIIADLPDITGQISRLLGAYTSSSLSMPIPLSGPGKLGDVAFQATTPGRTMIVAVVNDQPAWGGIVLRRAGGTDGTISLACATLEAYFNRRRVRSHTWTQQDEAAVIAAGLLGDAGTILGVGSGIELEIDAPPTGRLRDRTYVATDRATVYDRLRDLMAVQGGPEWTIELLWGDDTHTWVRKVVRVRDRIGVAATSPQAVFETTAASVFSSRGVSEARYAFDEDYSDGKGANYVVAYSTGEAEDQPTSSPAIGTDLLAAGWPIFEEHFQPASDISTVSVLDSHAQRTLQLKRHGALTWQIEARWSVFPRLNVDWRLGDDIAWQLTGHRHPGGITGQGRCIGWDLDPQAGLVKPILLDPLSNGGT